MKLDKTSFEVYKAMIISWFIIVWISNIALMFAFSPDFIIYVDIMSYIIFHLVWAVSCVLRK